VLSLILLFPHISGRRVESLSYQLPKKWGLLLNTFYPGYISGSAFEVFPDASLGTFLGARIL